MLKHVLLIFITIFPALAYGFTDKANNYSIQFPKGWSVTRTPSKYGTIISTSKDKKAFYKVFRFDYQTRNNLDADYAREFGRRMLESIQETTPSAELIGANAIKSFAGRPAIALNFDLKEQGLMVIFVVANGGDAYQLMYVGPKSVFDETKRNTLLSFKIL